MTKSFYDWCMENSKYDLLDMWDENLNDKSPNDVTYRSDQKAYFSCGNPKHHARHLTISSMTCDYRTGKTKDRICIGCHSVGKYFEENYGEDYLELIWSDKNEIDPYDIALNSKSEKIWLRCLTNPEHPDYELTPTNIRNAFGCPYCRNRKVYDGNNVALLHPEIWDYWSDENKTTPDQYTVGSHTKAIFSCHIPIHPDYTREIRSAVKHGFECPICLKIEAARKGKDHPYYNGNQSEASRIRSSADYMHWRDTVFKRDDYTCQCCGKRGVKLNAHHIYCFALYKDLRFDPNNGLTLCEECHAIYEENSLHFCYGIDNVTPQQLETYINNKRKELGIIEEFSVKQYTDLLDPIIYNNEVNTA